MASGVSFAGFFFNGVSFPQDQDSILAGTMPIKPAVVNPKPIEQMVEMIFFVTTLYANPAKPFLKLCYRQVRHRCGFAVVDRFTWLRSEASLVVMVFTA